MIQTQFVTQHSVFYMPDTLPATNRQADFSSVKPLKAR